MIKKSILLTSILLLFTTFTGTAQREVLLTMDDVIMIGQIRSLEATAAKNNFLSNYWSYRSYKASMLPSLNFSANVFNFDRSLRALQNSETGVIRYRENYNMDNSGSIFIQQQIAGTGGTLTLRSNLSRLDQYSPTRYVSYYAQPVTLSYLQPIFKFNSLKWDKKIEPEKYEKAKREYLEQLETVTIKSVRLFFDLLLSEMNYDLALRNYDNTKAMYEIAQKRHEIGSTKQAALLQLELRVINDSIAINTQRNNYRVKVRELRSFLGLDAESSVSLKAPEIMPGITIDGAMAVDKALANSSFLIAQNVLKMESERDVDRAKGNRGLSMEISTQFGLSNSANNFADSYSNLLDKEILGLKLSIPIMDWGMGKGRVKLNMARYEATLNKIEQAVIDYKEDIYIQVMKFNAQRDLCRLVTRAKEIADERYMITMRNFENGTVTVSDLNTAQTEMEEAQRRFINELSNYWLYYYNLRKAALYDFITNTDISAEYDKIIE